MTLPSGGRLHRFTTAGAHATRAMDAAVARPLHAGVAAAVAGLVTGPRMPGLAVGLAVGGLCLAVWSATAGLRRARADGFDPALRALRRRWAPTALGLAVVVLLAVAAADIRLAALERSRLAPLLGHDLAARAVVQQAPRASRFGGWSALADVQGEPVLLRSPAEPGASPPVGAVLDVRGSLRAPGPFATRLHAHAELRARRMEVAGRRGGVPGAVDGVRARAEAALDRGLPPAAAGLLRGMVLGQDAALPDAVREDFRAAGLTHLVAASGTNVVLLAALAMAAGTALGLGLTGRLWLVLALIALYVPLAGGGASIQRAGIMGAAAAAAGLVGRPASRWYAIGVAALVTLVLDPRAAGEPGWQLSFVAVVSLLVLAPRWRGGLAARGVPGPLADVLAMTAAATLATAPVIAAHFGQASLVSIPANLLAAPAVAPVMWLGVAASLVGQGLGLGGPPGVALGAVADGLDALAGFPLGYLTWVGHAAAGAPGAVVDAGPWPIAGAAAAVVLAVSVRRPRRAVPVAAVAAAAAWVGLAGPSPAPAGVPPGLRITFLDVGQGDATLVQDGPSAVLVDAGLPDAGIVGLLRRAGVRRLDLFVATHASADHEGGAAAVVGGVPVGAALDGRDGVATPGGDAMAAVARARGVRLVVARAGQVLTVGGLRLRVLWPPPEPAARHAGADPNERAVVLEVSAGGARALLTADAESGVLSRLALRPVDVLKVSHHGSEDPGLPAVLARLRPRIAGIEVGAGNTYGHPAPSTLAALRGVPVVVRTDRDGSVRLDHAPSGAWAVRAHASPRRGRDPGAVRAHA